MWETLWTISAFLVLIIFYWLVFCLVVGFISSIVFIILWIKKKKKLWVGATALRSFSLSTIAIIGIVLSCISVAYTHNKYIESMTPEERTAYYAKLEEDREKEAAEKAAKEKEKAEEKKKEEKKHEHTWVDATCENPSTCSGCNATKDSALGHTTDCGICSRCKKEFRKPSPITIINWTYTIDYVGGVEWNLNIRNNTDKQIKYVTLKWDCYNAVGDLIRDDINWKTYCKVRYTGPLNAHSTSNRIKNTTKFYNHTLKSYKMTEIVVEYMDGTTENVTNYHDNILE